jgi:diguanylate cyclase (GGDEF)-like protein
LSTGNGKGAMSAPRPEPSTQARVLLVQHDILEMIATGSDLRAAMDALCRRVEGIVPGVICSVLGVDALGRLHHLGSPSLPLPYAAAVDGLPIGPKVGSCGTAAFRGEPVETRDIQSDPLWADYRDLPLPPHVRACWSTPIKARDGRVIGTFAFYYSSNRGASDTDREVVDVCIHLCAIAIEKEAAGARLRRLAYQDSVTGLMNRAAFHTAAVEAIAAASTGKAVAIHYVDLDEFKSINDTLGHQMGDLLLQAVAQRLRSAIDGDDLLARLGGDEFAVVQQRADHESAAVVAWSILAAFDEPFTIADHELRIDASIGIVLAPSHGETLDDLLKSADLALYRAKSNGRGRYEFYSEDLANEANYRRAMACDLKRALDQRQFELVYQPIVALETGRTVACEALLRWWHPERGLIPTPEFIAVAEELGLIVKIGQWVLQEACRQAASWPDDVAIAINLSPLQLKSRALPDEVASVLLSSGLAADRLILEITETAILADEPTTRQVLLALNAMGVHLALDDFGTGYSPLWALREFPIERIKIDRSFIRDLVSGHESVSIVRAIIALAGSLGMSVTAEGVETPAQAAALLNEGCDDGQGFHFSFPLSAERALAHLAAERADLLPERPISVMTG